MKYEILEKYRAFIGDNEFFDSMMGVSSMKKKKPKMRKRGEEYSETEGFVHEAYTFQSSPTYVKGELRDYQIEGVNWLINMYNQGINCILADEMGLGKTLQTITFIGYLKLFEGVNKAHLLIVPKSILHNWQSEVNKFIPELKMFVLHAPKKELKKTEQEMKKSRFDVCITTFEMCLSATNILKKIKWSYIIIDEAHRLKNESSMLSKVVRLFESDHRLLLTGTPLQNNVHELWALLNFLVPELFINADRFESWIMNVDHQNEEAVSKLRNILQAFFLRREKSDVELTLLPKITINLYAELSKMQREWYKSILEKDLTPILGKNETKSVLMNIVCQLRKCCNHPYLFEGAEPGPPFTTDVHLIENSGKLKLLDKLLANLKIKGSRVLIFSQMSRMVDILEDYCIFKEYEYCRLDGSVSTNERTEAINEFNREGSDKFIFLLTTRAGGLGINLATADVVVLYDTDWNPRMDLQAQDRAHRIGQKKQVYVFRLVSENTIEERIVQRSLQKLKLDEVLVKRDSKVDTTIDSKDLLDILAAGIDEIYDEKVEVKEKSIEEIIARSEEKTRELNMKLENIKLNENQSIDLYKWEGEDYKTRPKFDALLRNRPGNRSTRMDSSHRLARPKVYLLPDYQFFPRELHQIQEDENRSWNKILDQKMEEKKLLLYKQGFINWTKKDYMSYIKACEKYGKDNEDKIVEAMNNKDEDEVRNYHKVFWERVDELTDAEKIISMIKRREEKNKKQMKIKEILSKLFCDDNWKDIKISYTTSTKSKQFSDLADKYLLFKYYQFIDSSECYQIVKNEIRQSRKFMYDFYIQTRSITEIQKRINVLAQNILKIHESNNK
ncbi:putative global transcription activator SNF2L1 [Astathelohania contejeani]|uniref:Global transcription activator SNF2L1 n=1 Tax=Astathelohania contejeani TaxID=164912 RepID=A0ABQ7I116_9MICR|nr:putative global transcription activator SNF2L1 [Thelohania contejeani]